MCGSSSDDTRMWSHVSAEQRIPAEYPLRPIRKMVDEILAKLSPRFDEMYSKVGRPSIQTQHF